MSELKSSTSTENESFIDSWFATQVDRCFETGMYGNGYRLYTSHDSYVTIEGVSYDEENNILKVKDKTNKVYVLSNEPDNETFQCTLLKTWKKWDSTCGMFYGEDRCDYKPWAFTSLKALAITLKLHTTNEDDDFEIYVR